MAPGRSQRGVTMKRPPVPSPAEIVAAARACGADLAGIAALADLRASPSHEAWPRLGPYDGVGTVEPGDGDRSRVRWPEGARSVVVLAVAHPEAEPHLDAWHRDRKGGTEGNQKLIEAALGLARWLGERGVAATPLPYHVERGGLFLKDAAVLAGLGCLGRNNLLVTPAFGPRVRLRAVAVEPALTPTGPSRFDPCAGCPAPCRSACPQGAFRTRVYDPREVGVAALPGRDGSYDRMACNLRMRADEAAAAGGPVYYCRRCEFACPVGREP